MFLVRERGYADDEAGRGAVAVLEEVLDAVQADPDWPRAHLCIDYSAYKGSSNAIRLEMLRRVVDHPAMGVTAFHGARWHTRAVTALLRAVHPRLEARHFADRQRALDHLRTVVEREGPEPTPPPSSLLDEVFRAGLRRSSLVMLRLREGIHGSTVVIRGDELPCLAPPAWRWTAPDGGASVTCELVGDDVLRIRLAGAIDGAAAAACGRLEEAVLTDLGPVRLYAVYDGREARRVATETWPPAASEGRFVRSVVVGPTPGLEAARSLAAASGPGGPPEAADLDEAWGMIEGHRARVEAHLQAAALPDDPTRLREVVHRQHEALLRMKRTQERLFESIARISWPHTRADALSRDLPEPCDGDDGFWALEGALHLMRQDLAEMLQAKDRQAAELERASRAAREASRAKSHFLGVVSHELRTPLNAIVGLSSLLAETGRLGASERRQVDGIRQASRRLERLVEDLLDFTRLEAGALRLEPRPFDLEPLLAELRAGYAHRAEGKGLELAIPTPGDGRLRSGDRDRLAQVLTNLLDNAIKFTDRGRVTLDVRPDPDGCTFEVRDTGRGIPPEDAERVFRRFEQTRPRAGEVLPGVGLGLNISRHLVRLMGGELLMESRVDRGTTFRFRLPLPVAEPAPQPRPGPGPLPYFGGTSVLVVEDDRLSRVVARGLLEHLGCRVSVAEDGEAGLLAWQEEPVDLVLMDCQLPRMDGFEVTRVIRQREGGGRVPIVAMTAHALAEDQARAADAGMDDFLAKPVSSDRLAAVLERHLPEHRRDEDQPASRPPEPDLAELFEETGPELVARLQEALRGDRQPGYEAAHRLLGEAAWLEASSLVSLCRPLTRGPWPDDAAHRIDRITTEVALLTERLRSADAGRVERPAAGPARLLLVDDDPLVLRLTASALTQLGYRTECAADAEGAAERFRGDPDGFDAVVLDQRLPDTTGLELLASLRRLRPELPALICSGEPVDEDAAPPGPTGFAVKPVRARELDEILRALVPRSDS